MPAAAAGVAPSASSSLPPIGGGVGTGSSMGALPPISGVRAAPDVTLSSMTVDEVGRES